MGLPVHLWTEYIVGGDSGVSGDMSASITSLYVNLDEAVSYSVQAAMSGTMIGVIELQASNDIVASSAAGPTNWSTIPQSIATVNGAGSYMVNVELPAYSWVRLLYTPTSGTGTMTANINGKRR